MTRGTRGVQRAEHDHTRTCARRQENPMYIGGGVVALIIIILLLILIF